MNWILFFEIAYVIIMLLVIFRVVYDTRSGAKTLAYILFIVLVPVLGMLFYFSFGINYRKRRLYSRKIIHNDEIHQKIISQVHKYSNQVLNAGLLPKNHHKLAHFIENASNSPLTGNNTVKILLNGEEKFPQLLEALNNARSHIHIEYYIYENDITGNSIAEILIKKAEQGVEVRFLYDDFGSHSLGKNFLKKLEDGGVETAPFYKIKLYAFANSINYRNHRKIVVIDGKKSFIGGMNISDRYRNDTKQKEGLYWRDTHLLINGPGSSYLQYLFLCDWNFCSKNKLEYSQRYFPNNQEKLRIKGDLLQIVPSGPDSKVPVIFYTIMEAIGLAKEEILITTPYFIPGESLIDTLIIAAKSGLTVKILVPDISDSKLVNAAARSYYTDLLQHGVQIFLYQKGFIHAKTMVIDSNLAIVGSANMDYRSFDLNFEVNAMLYDKNTTEQLKNAFNEDLKHAVEINAIDWVNRPKYIHLWEKFIRLLSPFF